MDAATRIYENILAEGEAGLQNMKKNRERETNLLDFKRAKDQSAPLKQDDRTHLAKSIGGFANSDGGVLVWGVDARVVNGVDGVYDLYPIKKLKQFKSELEVLTPKIVYPLPDGILHTPIIPNDSIDEGYIVTLIPAFEGLPVRSTIKDLGTEFYHRAGDEFQAMSHSHLADRFGRRPQPILRVYGRISRDGSNHWTNIEFYVENHGRGVARNVAVMLDADHLGSPLSAWAGDSNYQDISDTDSKRVECREAPNGEVIHPSRRRKFASFYSQYNEPQFNRLLERAPISYQVFCDGFAHSGQLVMKPEIFSGPSQLIHLAE